MKSATLVFFGLILFLIYLNTGSKLERIKSLLAEPKRSGGGNKSSSGTVPQGNTNATLRGTIGNKGAGTSGTVLGTPPFNPFGGNSTVRPR